MSSPWEPYKEHLKRLFKDKDELAGILAKLPSWPPERVHTLFIIDDDEVTRDAVRNAIEAATAVVQIKSNQQRFRELLKKTYIWRPHTEVIDVVVRHFPSRLREVETPSQALALYKDAQSMPGSSTKAHLFTQHALHVSGPLFPDGAKASLLKAYHSGRPCVIKFLSPSATPASGVEAGGTEAKNNRILCGDMPAEVPLVPARLVTLELGEGHLGLLHPPGTYAVLVMPKYVDTLESALLMPHEALLHGMRRMVEALDWIHSHNLVHMDVKGANVFVDAQGFWFLGDLGSAVEVGSPITSTTDLLLPAPMEQLKGQPARCEFDWYMLLVALVCHVQRDTWREELLDSTESYTVPAKLKASAGQLAAIIPELQVFVTDLMRRAGDLLDTDAV